MLSTMLLPTFLIAKRPEEPVEVSNSFVRGFRQNVRDAHSSVHSETSRAAQLKSLISIRKGPAVCTK